MNYLFGKTPIIVILVTFAAGCAGPGYGPTAPSLPSSAEQPRPGMTKRITTVIRGNPFALAQAINAGGAGTVPGVDQVEALIHTGLAVEDGQGRLQPRLAERVPSQANGLWQVFPDGRMETTWVLLPNLMWQDSTPFTPDDLAFTVQVLQEPTVELARTPAYELIERIDSPDPRTVTVVWKKPFIKADALFATINISNQRILPMPKHLLEAEFRQDPSSFTQLPYWTRGFVGLGPYRVHDYLEGTYMTLRASDNFVQGRPRIDEIEVKFIPDPNTIAANVLADAIDLTLGGRFSIDWGINLRDRWSSGKMEVGTTGSFMGIFAQLLSPNPPVLGENAFREALLRSLDRREMSDTIQAGLAPVTHSLIGSDQPEFAVVDPHVVKYDYDPRRAVQLVEGFGYARGGDGGLRDATGQRLTLEIRTRGGDDLQEKTLWGASDYFQRIGITMEPLIFPALRANDREFRSTHPGLEVVRQPAGGDALQRYHGSDVPTAENNYRGVNRTRYRNAELDILIDRYSTTIPERERNDVLAQAINHMTRNIVVLGVYAIVDPTMVSNRLAGVDFGNPTWNAHEWNLR
jgi:peptide/nickel transport system substrate-binding protein